MQIKKLIFIITTICLVSNSAVALPSGCSPMGESCSHCTTKRCDAGYFGDALVVPCASCAIATNNPSATSVRGSWEINLCYLPTGTTGSDISGNWEINNGKCYYNS